MFEQHSSNRLVAIVCGITGGMGKYLFIDATSTYIIKLAQAGITALICGLMGAVGKYVVDLFWPRLFKPKKP